MLAAGSKSAGQASPISSASEISLNQTYAVEAYIGALSNVPDWLMQRALQLLVAMDSPIDVTYAEIGPTGRVWIEGRATHNSPVLIIGSAIVLLLAGIGITLVVSNFYTLTDAVVAGGRLPGGAPGDRGSEGQAPASPWDLIPLAIVGAVVFLVWRK